MCLRFVLAILFLLLSTAPARADPITFTIAGVLIEISVAQLLIGTALSVALGFVQRALTPKPKASRSNADRAGGPQMVRSAIAPHQVVYGTCMVSGPLIYGEVSGSASEFLHLVVPLAVHEIEAIDSVWFNDVEITSGQLDGSGNVTSGRFANRVRIKKHLGSVTQAADADLVAEVANWTSAHQGKGIAYIYLRLKWDRDTFPTGIPNVKAVVRGRKVWDPRLNPGNPGSRAFSANAALCQLDYLMSGFGFGVPLAETHEASWVAAANVSDEAVSIAAGGTQDRYTCDGSLLVDQKPAAVMDDLLSASAGTIVYQQGTFRGYAAASTPSTRTLTESDLREAIRVVPRPGRAESFNAVRGTFTSAAENYMPTDFPPITNATFESEDGGERVFQDIELPMTTDAVRAQRIGNLHLLAHRQGIVCIFPAKLTAFDIATYDVVSLTVGRLGWANKEFRVLEWALADNGGIDLTLQEEAASIYAFGPGDEIAVDPAPDTNLPDPFTVGQPGAPEIADVLYQTRDGAGVKAKAVLTWVASADAFVDEYQPEFKLASASTWTVLPHTPDPTAEILDIAPALYDFRVKAINALGVSSAYSMALNRPVEGLAAPPAAPANLTMVAISSLAVLRWDQHPDLDVRIGGRIVFRHSPLQVGARWEGSTSIGEAVAGSETVALLPLKVGSYLAKGVDSLGIRSAAAASVSTKAGKVLAFANLSMLAEDPLFNGSHSGTAAPDALLKLAGVGLFDAIPSLDAVFDLDSYGGIASRGTYTFGGGIDLGSVKRTRLESALTALVVNTLDKIDDRTALINDWEDFDGPLAGSADAVVWVRETDDDPGGSPAWSAWQRLDVAEFQARGFQFQARLKSDDPAYNIQVSALTVTADEVI